MGLRFGHTIKFSFNAGVDANLGLVSLSDVPFADDGSLEHNSVAYDKLQNELKGFYGNQSFQILICVGPLFTKAENSYTCTNFLEFLFHRVINRTSSQGHVSERWVLRCSGCHTSTISNKNIFTSMELIPFV